MLLDFTIENFRSYRDEKRFQLTPSSSKVLLENCVETGITGITALKTAAIYGANASGKTTLLAGMHLVGQLVRNPVTDTDDDAVFKSSAFALDPQMLERPTSFAVRFIHDTSVFHYTISIRHGEVESEQLIAHPEGGRGQEWFRRQGDNIKFNTTHLKGPNITAQ